MFFYIWTGPINDFLSWTGWSPIAKVNRATKIHCKDSQHGVGGVVVVAMMIFVAKVKMVTIHCQFQLPLKLTKSLLKVSFMAYLVHMDFNYWFFFSQVSRCKKELIHIQHSRTILWTTAY